MGTDEQILAEAQGAFERGVDSKSRLLQARKHFSESTDAYLELHRRGIRTPALYANLGNAAVLADRWSEAIWAYQLGLKLDPNDKAMRDHLTFARGKVIYPPAGQGRLAAETWPYWAHRPTMDGLFVLFAAAYLLTWFAATGAFVGRQFRFLILTGILIGITTVFGVGLWQLLQQAWIDRETPIVVLVGNTDFHRGNAASYPKHDVLPLLPRGLEARQLHRRGAWLQIRLTTGETGWVHASNVLVVEP